MILTIKKNIPIEIKEYRKTPKAKSNLNAVSIDVIYL